MSSGNSELRFHDDGCDLFSSCLSCPLPACQFDETLYQQFCKAWIGVVFRLYFEHGYTIKEIADRLPGTYYNKVAVLISDERKRRAKGLPNSVEGYTISVESIR